MLISSGNNVEDGMRVGEERTESRGSSHPNFEIDFDKNDPTNPKNWPLLRGSAVLAAVSYATLVVVFYSSSYTAGVGGMKKDFDISSTTVTTLGITSYMLGLAIGFAILAPLSETYSRRPVYLVSYGLFFILVLPCCLASSFQQIIIARFFG